MAVKTKANKDAADAYMAWCNNNMFPFDFDFNQIQETYWDIKLYKRRKQQWSNTKLSKVPLIDDPCRDEQ